MDATLSWNANTESDLAGYKIYYGLSTGVYTANSGVLPPSLTTKTITGLTDGVPYFFAMTAIDNENNESALSSEVSKTNKYVRAVA